jgi:CubicO group peptidase (beta-lactamase class C family)
VTARVHCLWLFAALLACGGAESPTPTPVPAPAAPRPTPSSTITAGPCIESITTEGEDDGRLAAALCREAQSASVVGAQLAVVDHGQVVLSWAIGHPCLRVSAPMTTTTRQRIGSLTKLLTAVTLQSLAAEGRIDLDARLTTLAPDFVPAAAASLTMRHLLSHTSGLAEVPPAPHLVGMSPAQLAVALVGDGPRYEPGTRFEYLNTGYVLAGLVASEVVGPLTDEIVARTLTGTDANFVPRRDDACGHLPEFLGQRAYRPEHDLGLFAFGATYTAPAGGVMASAEELALLIARHAPTAIAGPHLPTDVADEVYASGLRGRPGADETRVWFHPGQTGDFSADAWWIEDTEVAVVLIANGSRPLRATGLAATQLFGDAELLPRP